MSKHTAGKWKVGGKDKTIVYAGDGYAVASCAVHHGRFADGEAESNARLIAAAPELISLLKEARSTLEMWKDVAPAVSLCADIDKAIAKAT